MIPKIIHYCWFGDAQIPDEQQLFIQEWRNIHPDWEFMLWNEGNSPMEVPYMKTAGNNGMWANMSNYIRLFSLKEYGGVYLDTDVKVIKCLDTLLDHKCFLGFEEGDDNEEVFWVNNAICGAEKDHPFIGECYDLLLNEFDGKEQSNLSGPRLTTSLLVKSRKLQRYGYQELSDLTLFPKEYFYPVHYSDIYKLASLEQHIFPETIAVHIWARTWLTKEMLLCIVDDLYKKLNRQASKSNSLLFNHQINSGVEDSGNRDLKAYAKLQYEQIAGIDYFLRSVISEMLLEKNRLQQENGQQRLLTAELTAVSEDAKREVALRSAEIKSLKDDAEVREQQIQSGESRLKSVLKKWEEACARVTEQEYSGVLLSQRISLLEKEVADKERIIAGLGSDIRTLGQDKENTIQVVLRQQQTIENLVQKVSACQENLAENALERKKEALHLKDIEMRLAEAGSLIEKLSAELASKTELLTRYQFTYADRSLAGIVRYRLFGKRASTPPEKI